MTSPPPVSALFDTLAVTWPAARTIALPPFLLRDGQGGGQRVSAATATANCLQDSDIARAEAAMRAMGQVSLFRLRPEETALDAQLAARGYRVGDPTVLRACPVAALLDLPLPRVSAFSLWEPLQIMRDIWAEAGIGPARMAVMGRVNGPKAALLGRSRDKSAGVGFVALHDTIAMVHALEVRADCRRQGTARHLMIAAARWAADHGARHVALAVTEANAAGNALYASLKMPVCGRYHYRIRED